jgi:iron-sulfur cluster repair protein YtfE (RIC family)
MLRDPALVPLSHQHQHALALCVFIQRALSGDRTPAPVVRHWEGEIDRVFRDELRYHFEAEERHLFPAAEHHRDLVQLVADLRRQHDVLRTQAAAAAAHRLGNAGLSAFVTLLTTHVRLEERELFEKMQEVLPHDELARVGKAMDDYFQNSGMPAQACGLPFNPDSEKESA